MPPSKFSRGPARSTRPAADRPKGDTFSDRQQLPSYALNFAVATARPPCVKNHPEESPSTHKVTARVIRAFEKSALESDVASSVITDSSNVANDGIADASELLPATQETESPPREEPLPPSPKPPSRAASVCASIRTVMTTMTAADLQPVGVAAEPSGTKAHTSTVDNASVVSSISESEVFVNVGSDNDLKAADTPNVRAAEPTALAAVAPGSVKGRKRSMLHKVAAGTAHTLMFVVLIAQVKGISSDELFAPIAELDHFARIAQMIIEKFQELSDEVSAFVPRLT